MTGGGLFCFKPSVYLDVVHNPPTSDARDLVGQLKSLYRRRRRALAQVGVVTRAHERSRSACRVQDCPSSVLEP
jgi:hypothetical protein